ncbi:MAG TPA: pectinesterase family protein [Verrucomicrobiae bacterium]|nr:pectinesterase family protein [Verrucomicrobiae bacterium]
MTMPHPLRVTTHNFRKSLKSLAAGAMAVGLALFIGVGDTQAQVTYNFTNTAATAFLSDPNAWSPVGGPGTNLDTFTILQAATKTLRLTNNFLNNGSFQIGASGGGQTLNLTLDFGTNTFVGLNGNTTSGSDFVFGQQGTTIVYIACGSMYNTNAGAPTGNARMTVGRNSGAATSIFFTNGTFVGGITVIANNAGATPSQLVVSGSGSSWSNANGMSIGNVALANNCSLAISNSASMTVMSTFQLGFQAPSSFNSVIVDSSGQLFTRNQTATIGAGSGSSNNTVTVQGGGIWDNGGRIIQVGNTTGVGSNNSLVVGNNGVVSNVTVVTIAAGDSLKMAGGLLRASVGVTNNAGAITGFGTIAANTAYTAGTSALSLGSGSSVGTLTFTNNLSLVSGTTTRIKLDSSQSGSNDFLNVLGTLANAGTITIVTNGTAPLSAGDVYTIFAAGALSGGFTSSNLPALDPSLRYDLTQFPQGILKIVPQEVVPGLTGPTNQVILVGSNAIISATVTGVPTPGVYWQYNGNNITDGATGNGSTIAGSQTLTLTLSNGQTNDSGSYCIIATNSQGSATNCMGLTVSNGNVPPSISGMSDQTVIQGNNGTFNASVAGSPSPGVKWQVNGIDIPGATGIPLILTNVQFSQDGFLYTLIATNSSGSATNSQTLHVIVAPIIATQPQSLVVTQTQSATFCVVSTNGVPTPTYQWFFGNSSILNATSTCYTITSATPANAGTYRVRITNTAGTIDSTNVTLTVNSTMAAVLTPANGAPSVCYDTPLFMAFDRLPVLNGAGKVSIYNVTNPASAVDTIDTSLGVLQSRTIGGETFSTFPVIITGTTVAIYPHLGVLGTNQTYFVTVDAGIFTDTNGALYAGIVSTNGWVFTTKPAGPANPLNVIVSTNESDDFATVQGAVDSVPANNTTPTLINIRNGTYTEIVDTRLKNNITFRGQDRTKTRVGYPNNNNINGSTANRMAFKINANDNAIENMTVTNMTPKGGSQAEAIMVNTAARRFILNYAEVDSFQDTILINDFSSQAYFYKSLIVGDTDFIWGVGNLFATNCEIRSVTGGASITQPRTPAGSNGLDFVDCQITRGGTNVTNTTFGRALGFCDGNAAFINCQIDSNVVGWTAADLTGCPNLRWWTYNDTDLLTGSPLSFNGVTLTNGDPNLACALSPTCWLSGWVPQLAPNILTNPVSVTVTAGVNATFTVAATGIPDPNYQWLKNGATITGATGPTFVIPSALAGDAGGYSVIVSNIAGSITSGSATLTVVGTGPSASFTAAPTSGTEPLAVTFTDTSSGSPNITLFWDLGDSTTTNLAGGTTLVHSYAAGTYTVTLTASNAFGANSTIVSNNLITVVTAFQAWQLSHFGCTNCPQAAASADPDGDGQNNLAEFLAGTDPNNSASGLHISSVARSGSDVVITWATAGGATNVVQATAGDGNGGYTTNFSDLSGPIVITGSGDASTNYTDVGGGTNVPSRYYRVRLAP